MSKGRLKKILQNRGVVVTPIYKVVEKNGEFYKVQPTDPTEGVMHYRAEPKKRNTL